MSDPWIRRLPDPLGRFGTPRYGIDELLEFWVLRTFKYVDFGGSGQTIHLHATDDDDDDDGWLVSVNAATTDWRQGHNETAGVTASGRSSDLYLFRWNRFPSDRLEVKGDKDSLTRWRAAAIVAQRIRAEPRQWDLGRTECGANRRRGVVRRTVPPRMGFTSRRPNCRAVRRQPHRALRLGRTRR